MKNADIITIIQLYYNCSGAIIVCVTHSVFAKFKYKIFVCSNNVVVYNKRIFKKESLESNLLMDQYLITDQSARFCCCFVCEKKKWEAICKEVN